MATFNSTLPAGSVVVATHTIFSDNNGYEELAIVWTGEKVIETIYCNNRVDLGSVEVDATQKEKDLAIEWFKNNNKNPINLIGCVVKLKRSRKAPNGTNLKVVNHQEAYYDDYSRHYVAEQICVNFNGVDVWVSANCVDELVQCHEPIWA